MSFRADALDVMLEVALRAARLVTAVYEAPGLKVDFKVGDDPVTAADRQSNLLITTELARAFPGVPIVAEESDPASFAGFQGSPRAFFVDPLDGTREFVQRSGEFGVLVGLAEDGRATAGVIVLPTEGRAFVGAEGVGAFEVAADGSRASISVGTGEDITAARCVVSRWHRGPREDAILARLGARLVVCGSAGLKGLRVATGDADLFVHPAMAGYRWDSCAPAAIVRAAGGVFTDLRGQAIDYRAARLENDGGACVGNPTLHAAALARLGA